jgi:putative transposase
MPRASRHFLPGYVWHITHRYHQKAFLLKFARDRRRYLRWVFEAKKRFGLSVLNYMVTSNHIHLLVKDTGPNVIAQSMQLIAGRTAQEYNQRKRRQGAFWEDRYHATAIETDEHLHRCLVYINLNMVRAGMVNHPIKWMHSGYREIQDPPQRYAVIDQQGLIELFGFKKAGDFQETHRQWVAEALTREMAGREDRWSEAIAVGSSAFVDKVKSGLGVKAMHREVVKTGETYALREPSEAYAGDIDSKSEALRSYNAILWEQNAANSET